MVNNGKILKKQLVEEEEKEGERSIAKDTIKLKKIMDRKRMY
jgi:hypothetical protein